MRSSSAEQRVHRTLPARRILQAAATSAIGRIVKAHRRFVVLGAVEPVELVLHRRLDALELALERIDINGRVVVVGDVAGGGRQVVENARTRANAVFQFGELSQECRRAAGRTSAPPRRSCPEPQNRSSTRSPGCV